MCNCIKNLMATSLDDLKSLLFWRAVGAEMIGTSFLVFVGCGSCIGWEDNYSPSIAQIALCFGLIVATMVWCIAHISGGHINPAVTVSMLVTRKISIARAIIFIIAQCAGAIVGAGILKGVTPGQYQGTLGQTQVHPALTPEQGFGMELMITFVLVFTVFATCDSKRTDLNGSGPLTIGLSVAVCHLAAIKFTGSSMNPARTFGPAVIQGVWEHHWVYWCGPVLGGILAGLFYENIFAANASFEKAKGYLLVSKYNGGETFHENKEKPLKVIEDEEAMNAENGEEKF